MKKLFRIFLIITLLITGCPAALNAKTGPSVLPDSLSASEAFLRLPQSDLFILSEDTRRDMVDYMKADSVAKRFNVFRGKSWIEEMTPDYIRVHLTDVSSLQVRILRTDNRKTPLLAMSIYTVGADNGTSDSTIKFYDSAMKEIPAKDYFTLPDPKYFFHIPKGSGIKLKDLMEIMPFYTVRYSVSPSAPPELKGELTMSDYLTEEQLREVEKYLSPSLRWIWNGKKFSLQPLAPAL